MGFFDSIANSVESGITSKAQSTVTNKIYSVGSKSNKQTSQQNINTENAIKVTIEFKDRIVTISSPSVSMSQINGSSTNFQFIGTPVTTKK
ncbi:MAG: hypothetical protein QXD23_02005 [Candidatus Micrarchaeaceae archaeon]